jgi:hypothetical protein
MKYRKKPVVIEATQWFKNGDHPLDYDKGIEGMSRKANGWEGDLVRYYRHPGVAGDAVCKHCGDIMHNHGWIDTLEGGHTVCPGDYIITGVAGEHYPCKPGIFAQTYDAVTD